MPNTKPMTGPELEEFGRSVYGSTWHLRMAEDLFPHQSAYSSAANLRRVVYRWAEGSAGIPDWVAPALTAIAKERAAAAEAWAKRLRGRA